MSSFLPGPRACSSRSTDQLVIYSGSLFHARTGGCLTFRRHLNSRKSPDYCSVQNLLVQVWCRWPHGGARWGPVSYQTGPDQGDSSPKQNNSGTRLHGQSESKCEENSGGILKQFRNPQQGFRIGSSTEDLKGIMACGCEGLPEPCRTQLFGPTAPVYGSYTNKQKLSKPGQIEPLLAHHRFA